VTTCSVWTYNIPSHRCHQDNHSSHHNGFPLRCRPCLLHSGYGYLDSSYSWFHPRGPCSPPRHHTLVLTNHVLAVPSHNLSQQLRLQTGRLVFRLRVKNGIFQIWNRSANLYNIMFSQIFTVKYFSLPLHINSYNTNYKHKIITWKHSV